MFTGLVTAIGRVTEVRPAEGGRVLRIEAPYEALVPGESIAVHGTCLTVERQGRGWFEVHAVGTTVDCTTIGRWAAGRRVHLERALAVGDRMGGHWVQGHVDGVGVVEARTPERDALLLDVRVPPEVAAVTVPRGSIAVDGVSLTVHDLPEADVVRVALVPHTLQATVLGDLAPGDRVHVEGDLMGKYVRQLLAPHLRDAAGAAPGTA